MDVLAWDKRIVNERGINEDTRFEIYIFKNPKVTPPINKSNYYRIGTVDFNYEEWSISNEVLEKKSKVMLLGKGFTKDCFCYLNNESLNLEVLSKKMCIKKKYLEIILADYKTN